jgi:hypothetical protein
LPGRNEFSVNGKLMNPIVESACSMAQYGSLLTVHVRKGEQANGENFLSPLPGLIFFLQIYTHGLRRGL